MSERRGLRRLLWSAVVGVPPFFVINYFSVDKFGKEILAIVPGFASVLDRYPIHWMALATAWIWICTYIKGRLFRLFQASPTGWDNAGSIIFKVIDNIVGLKEKRFAEASCRALTERSRASQQLSAGAIFDEITQPELQIKEIVQGIYNTFDALITDHRTPDSMQQRDQLKANLAVIKSDRIVEIKYHYPNDLGVRSTIEALNSPRSGIQTARRTRRIVVVESIRDEGEKSDGSFVVTEDARAEEDGSLICYPILIPSMNEVAFVLSIFYSRRGEFKRRFRGSYVAVLKPFELRLRLEFNLLGLKEIIADGQSH